MADCYHRTTTANGKCADCGADQHGRNSHVVAAFHAGNVTIDRNGNARDPKDRIQSGNGNLASVRAGTGRNDLGNGQHAPVTFLQSYGVTIAIRRDSDGAIFLNGHSYSPSTGRHQREAGDSWRDGVSFPALTALLGPTWYENAEIIESAPQRCRSEHCEALHGQAVDAWRAAQVKTGTRTRAAHGYECADDCPTPCDNFQKWHGQNAGGRVVTEDVTEALDANGAPIPYPESRCMFVDIERETSYSRSRKLEEQGDVSGQPLADVIPADIMNRGAHELTGDARAGLLTRAGTIRNRHGCSVQGRNIPNACKRADCPPADAVRIDGLELPDAGGRHTATRAALTPRNVRFAQRGNRTPRTPYAKAANVAPRRPKPCNAGNERRIPSRLGGR